MRPTTFAYEGSHENKIVGYRHSLSVFGRDFRSAPQSLLHVYNSGTFTSLYGIPALARRASGFGRGRHTVVSLTVINVIVEFEHLTP